MSFVVASVTYKKCQLKLYSFVVREFESQRQFLVKSVLNVHRQLHFLVHGAVSTDN